MQHSEADHTGRQSVPGLLYGYQPVIANSHSPKALEPAIGPLDHPSSFSQTTAVLGPASGDVRFNPEPSQQCPSCVTVVASVGVQFVRDRLGPAHFAANLWEIQDERNDLLLVTDIRSSGADSQRHSVAIHQQRMFGAQFPAVHRAGAGFLATAKGPHDDPIHDDQIGIEFVSLAKQSQQVGVEPVPDTHFLPLPQPTVSGAPRAAHLTRNVLPTAAGDEDKPYDLENDPMHDPRASALGSDRHFGGKVMGDQIIETFG